jgi:WD40 repeat protein
MDVLFANLGSQLGLILTTIGIVSAFGAFCAYLIHNPAPAKDKWKVIGGVVGLIIVGVVVFAAILLWPKISSLQAQQSSLGNLLYTDRGHNGDISSIAWSPDGKRIASGSQNDGTVQVWDATTGTNRLTHHDVFFAWDTEGVAGLAWSPDGKYIASTTRFSVDIWDAITGKSLRTKTGYFIRDLAWLSDGTHLTFVDTGSTLHIWDITTGQDSTYHPDGSKAIYNDIAWSPDDSLIAYSNDKGFAVRDFPSWHVAYTYYCNCSHVDSISWAPNGRYLLAIITTLSKTTSNIRILSMVQFR